ncbi:MAG: PEP-CTERM sorting domain-containing protein [Planctomycetota bacterium]
MFRVQRSVGSTRNLALAAVALAIGFMACGQASAVVVISDGFGDADLDNNGVPLEAYDVDVSSAGLGTPGDSYEPVQSSMMDTIFADGVMVNEVTAVEDASDVGVPWYFTRGFTSGPTPPNDPKTNSRIIDDSVNALPDTNPAIGFTSPNTPGQNTVAALGSGLALANESKGRGSSVAAFFDDDYSDGNQGTISLGPNEGDKVRVSFDYRVWMSAPNFNGNTLQHIPTVSELRFGLFEDSDGQLGQANPFAGDAFTSAVWGSEGGNFRGDLPGAGGNGDKGWYARVPIEDPDEPDPLFRPLAGGADARIVEEDNSVGSGTDLAYLTGPQDSVAVPNQVTPNFVNLDYQKAYTLSLTLERFTDPDSGGTADTILSTLEVTDIAAAQTFSLSDYEPVGVAGTNDPDGGIESDSWDYFAMATIGNLDEFDWIIDNFMVEVIAAGGVPGDFDGDGDVDVADALLGQRNGENLAAGGDWDGGFGTGSSPVSAVGAVPEPASLAMLAGGLVALASRRRKR